MPRSYLYESQAFVRDPETGLHTIDPEATIAASNELSQRILTFQGDGDYEGVAAFVERYLVIDDELQSDLDRVAEAGIPVDIVFEQGTEVLGL